MMDAGSNLRVHARKNAMEQYAKKRGRLFGGAFANDNAKWALDYGEYPNNKRRFFGSFNVMSAFIRTNNIASGNPVFKNVDMTNQGSFNNALSRQVSNKREVSFGQFEIFNLEGRTLTN